MDKIVTLKKNKEFNFVYRKGKPLYTKDLTLVYIRVKYGGVKVGFSVSKKIGNAVTRNLCRRRLKEILLREEVLGNCMLVFVPKPSAALLDFETLKGQVNRLIGNLNKKHE